MGKAALTAQEIKNTLEDDLTNLEREIKKIAGDSDSELYMLLKEWLMSREIRNRQGAVLASAVNWKKYRSIAMAVAHSIRLLENGQQLPLKIVSSHIWGTSKVLDRYKKDIADATGMTLAELNLVVMPETRLKLLDNLGWQKRRYPTR